MKIIFAGTPEFAATSLETLIGENHYIIAVYTQPDRPAGRGKKLLASDVKVVAEKHQIPVYQPENFKSEDALKELKSLDADLMIVAAYGIILPLEVLETPRLGCINIHASLLPRWRGAAPIQRAIQDGDSVTGITIMQMDEGLDTGDMLLKLETPISDTDTGGSLHDRLATLGGEAITRYLQEREGITGEPQNNADACYAKKLSKQEAQVDWQADANTLARTVRAFNPWPVAFTEQNGERIRILEAHATEGPAGNKPGSVLSKNKEGISVACHDGILIITRLQLPGGKALSVEDFVNGGKAVLEPGTMLGPA